MMYRLQSVPGEWLDRTQSLWFTFEGRRYQGFVGDTITSALAGQGVMIFGRSFKYHRPRGILSFADRDVNALFQLGTRPNVRGDVMLLEDGLCAHAVNTMGGLARDYARVLDRMARFLPVGFYYKAFHSKLLFPVWEWWIRKLSGLGRIPVTAAGPRPPKRHAFCDVLVIGAGRSGVAAALAAAEAGAQVWLVDEQARLMHEAASAVQAQPRIHLCCGAFVAGCYADHGSAIVGLHGLIKVRSRATVLATGAAEQPLVFHNNDLPGVLLASAARRLLQRHAIGVGRAVALVTNDRAAYETALLLLEHGVAVKYLIDARAAADTDLAEALEAHGVKVLRNSHVVAAHADAAGCLCAISLAGTPQLTAERLECDALLMSGGWSPSLQLVMQAGGKVTFNDAAQMHVAIDLPAGWFVAGGANAVLDPAAKQLDGRRAGAAAAAATGFAVASADLQVFPARGKLTPSGIHADPRGKDFIDFDEDVQVCDLEDAAAEGFDSIELLKRYTAVGMGPSQGKHSNINAARVLARVRSLPMEQVGLTTARPMFHPVSLQHLAGRRHHIERATPLAQWHRTAGAVWRWTGAWRRPQYYAPAGQTQAVAVLEEATAARIAVGLIDVGTLGKIEVHGPDAAEFLDRAYTGLYSTLKVGMSRYGLLLDEAGTIVDDGVIARLHKHSFYFTTTTTGAVPVYRELARLNAQWGLNCTLSNLTGQYAAFNLVGPRSREVLSAVSSIHPSDAAFPYLAIRTALVGGVRARLLRVGFVSDLGFEIHVPFSRALVVWQALREAGTPLGLRPFGVEAQRLLRLERGHFIVGQDTDGSTNPFEAQAAWAVRMDKPFFVGQRSLRILERRGPRQLLVGFELSKAAPALRESHLVIARGQIAGRITSLGYSPTLAKTIGLAMVEPALAAAGTELTLRLGNGSTLRARVCATPFLQNARPGTARA
jgi:sarcosine oxidase subunit alpha